MIMKNLILIFVFVLYGSAASAQDKGNVLIKNGTVLTITKGTLPETDVLVKDGKIAQIAKNIAAPQGVRVIDAKGLFVMPGIIDAHSHIALDAINEATSPVTAEVAESDAINPMQINIYRALGGGVTTIHALHGSANAIGGQCQILKLRYGTLDPDALKMEGAPRTIKFALGENPTRVHGGGNNIVPRTRMGVEFVIRKSFSDAKKYAQEWEAYNKNKLVKGFRGAPPVYNLRLETLAEILKGNITIHCHSYRADEIFMLLRVCKDFGIKKIVFQHVNEGFKVAPELAAYGAMASVFSDWWAYKFEVYYSTAYNAAILTRNGVVTSINSDDAEMMRHLYLEAGKTQKYGSLTDEEALALITINPAKQLGVESRIGSLEVGKDADIAIFKNHPLSIYGVPQYTIVDGTVRFDRANDPADMRLMVDPKQNFDEATFFDKGVDHCLDGTEFLFTNDKN
ncbi:MAG: amidohydrolase [Cytophagales bacterium]|jgi:imidazolonepropionase-like amidohydrolase|nr:MAG: amidohydrolase [Cytophagales bacterium]